MFDSKQNPEKFVVHHIPDAFSSLLRNVRMGRTPRTAHRLLEILRVLINRFFGCRVTPGSMGTASEAQRQDGSHKFVLSAAKTHAAKAPNKPRLKESESGLDRNALETSEFAEL